jgi:hypothetical protein
MSDNNDQLELLREIRDLLREQTDDAKKSYALSSKQMTGCLVAAASLAVVVVLLLIAQSVR